ncbi:YolD-like family protein [Paenibacillus sp. Pae108]|uniref:YolD-like family protein n=1 Tax=Paenibacillus sp. Pae108 TaxID=2926019 RepID=UPI002117E3FA|nr:YolD-like family protein [Paenibacillus sp. Pae108]
MNKPNKLTPGANLMWESSRMIIPEHKEAINRHRKESGRKQRPVLDEQRQQDLGYAIGEAMANQRAVTLVLFGEYEDREVTGTVEKVDRQLRRMKVITGPDEYEWVKFEDIVSVK